jgi:hypothetical protein
MPCAGRQPTLAAIAIQPRASTVLGPPSASTDIADKLRRPSALARLAGLAAIPMVVAACSSPAATASDGGDAATGDAGVACLFCLDASDDEPLASRVKGKIDQICSIVDGCHGSGAGRLVLAPGDEFQPLIDVPSSEMPTMLLVVPGRPDESYLYKKVACDGGIDGGCMPPSSRFDPILARLFFDWIEAGAPTR